MYLACGWRYNFGTPPTKPPRSQIRGDKLDLVHQTKSLPSQNLSHDFRPNWEFYAVVDGDLNMVENGAEPPPSSYFKHSLWISFPNSRHSWTAPPGKYCRILCFHFSEIPPLLLQSLDKTRPNRVSFRRQDVASLWAIFDRLLPDYSNPTYASSLIFASGLSELTAFFLKRVPHLKGKAASAFDPAVHKVNAAIQVFRGNLSQRLSVAKVAELIGVSPAHLRKLFLDVYGRSTQEVFDELRMEMAKELLRESSFSLKEVAVRCGYGAYSQFYRAFNRHTGLTPMDWTKGKVYGPDNLLKG
jgi:AraC family transcriptional regulator